MLTKNFSLKVARRALAFSVIAFICGPSAIKAQTAARTTATRATRSAYLITARAGVINFVSGAAKWQKSAAETLQPLTSNDELESGDGIATGADGFVEMLLSPGAYLRIGANSQVELTDASLDNLTVTIKNGSAILEASGFGGARTAAKIQTPQKPVFVLENGLYRFNVAPDETQILVYKGALRVGDLSGGLLVKKKKMLTLRANATPDETLAALKTNQPDQLDRLSQERAKILAQVNSQLAYSASSNTAAFNNAMQTYLISDWRWQSLFGLWAFDPLFYCYTFLPFDVFYSPYGFYYPSVVYIPYYYYRIPKGGVSAPIPHRPIHLLAVAPSARITPIQPNGSNAPRIVHPSPMRTMPERMPSTERMMQRSMPMHAAPSRLPSLPSSPMRIHGH